MTPESIQSLLALALGFAVAGLSAEGYQLVARQMATFELLHRGPKPSTFAALPVIYFAAPMIIMRNTLRSERIEKRSFHFVMLATIIAGLWSLMSGTIVVMVLRASGILQA